MPLYIAKSGDLEGCHGRTHSQTLKDRATQLLIKYKSGALVTQKVKFHIIALDKDMWPIYLKNGNTLQKNSLVFSLKMKKLNEVPDRLDYL